MNNQGARDRDDIPLVLKQLKREGFMIEQIVPVSAGGLQLEPRLERDLQVGVFEMDVAVGFARRLCQQRKDDFVGFCWGPVG